MQPRRRPGRRSVGAMMRNQSYGSSLPASHRARRPTILEKCPENACNRFRGGNHTIELCDQPNRVYGSSCPKARDLSRAKPPETRNQRRTPLLPNAGQSTTVAYPLFTARFWVAPATARVAYPGKGVSAMAKTKCRPERTGKSGRKSVSVKRHKRTPPKPIRKKCG